MEGNTVYYSEEQACSSTMNNYSIDQGRYSEDKVLISKSGIYVSMVCVAGLLSATSLPSCPKAFFLDRLLD